MDKKNVQQSYNSIAREFSRTRNYPWPEFEIFSKYIEPEQKLLDLGCGNGRLYEFLKKFKITYTGLDLSVGLLEEAKNNFPEASFVQADMKELPFKDHSFDQVWAIASFHHLENVSDRKKCLNEVSRILNPGGFFVLTCWNLFQCKYLPFILKNFLSLDFWIGKRSVFDTAIPWKDQNQKILTDRYYYAFLPSVLRKLLQEQGFIVKEIFYTKKGQRVSFWQSYNMCVIAQKPLS